MDGIYGIILITHTWNLGTWGGSNEWRPA